MLLVTLIGILLCILGGYLLTDHQLFTLKPTDGMYVFFLGGLMVVAVALNKIPNKKLT
jgi:hypothetical protein